MHLAGKQREQVFTRKGRGRRFKEGRKGGAAGGEQGHPNRASEPVAGGESRKGERERDWHWGDRSCAGKGIA